MDNQASFNATDSPDKKQDGISEAISSSAAPAHFSQATTDDSLGHDSIAQERPAPIRQRSAKRSDARPSHQMSKSIRLEPPPVISRPPKIKTDSFLLSWFSWSRTEHKMSLYCARSIHRSYYYQSTFSFFGFNISKDITYRTSEGGVDAAVENVRLVGGFCRIPNYNRKVC